MPQQTIRIKTLRPEGLTSGELKHLINYTIEGMNLRRYISHPLLLSLYTRYFISLELQKANHVYMLYQGQELVGALMFSFTDEKEPYQSFGKKVYVGLVEWIQKVFFGQAANPYNAVNQKLLASAKKDYDFAGELNYFAVNTEIKGQGLGTRLLEHAQKEHAGKRIYLYTDSGCSYQFYEKRGFDCLAKETISLEIEKEEKEMTCMLFSKVL